MAIAVPYATIEDPHCSCAKSTQRQPNNAVALDLFSTYYANKSGWPIEEAFKKSGAFQLRLAGCRLRANLLLGSFRYRNGVGAFGRFTTTICIGTQRRAIRFCRWLTGTSTYC